MYNKNFENNRTIIPDWHEKFILVVEDEDDNYIYLYEVLKRTKAVLVRADCGRKALDAMRKYRFDLVLMDIKLPDVDGYQVTRELRKIDNEVPVIAQTAYAMRDEQKKCIEAGCNDYISKPYNPETFISLLIKNMPE